ncbi:MAG: PSP1 C-terminal domain-containing protein [Trueperaceae bacterium]|nr:PSP1 C-terminal domain-containing protein [Trueperaceae bacterium]
MPECIGVRFDHGPRLYYVATQRPETPRAPETPSASVKPHSVEPHDALPAVGTPCVVRGPRGLELAMTRTLPSEVSAPVGTLLRRAEPDDVAEHRRLRAYADELKWLLRARVREAGWALKVVALDFTLDETVLSVYYSSEVAVSLRAFVKILLPYTAARIACHNVGPREQAQMIGTLSTYESGSHSSDGLQSLSSTGTKSSVGARTAGTETEAGTAKKYAASTLVLRPLTRRR